MSRLINVVSSRDRARGRETELGYRYRMPALEVGRPSRKSGRTALFNLSGVAHGLRREPSDVLHFLAVELSTSSDFDAARPDRSTLKGLHAQSTLQDLIYAMVDYCVLCPICGDGQTQLKVKFKNKKKPKKSGATVFRVCGACGAREPIDGDHKLTKAMINRAAVALDGGSKQQKKLKREAKKSAKIKELVPNGSKHDDEEEDWGDADFSADAIAARRVKALCALKSTNM